jgi:peptidoglycan lytic transglycosylase
MRRLTTRIVLFVIAAIAVIPASALAQAPSGGAVAPTGPPSPFQLSGGGNALVGKKVRFRGAVEPSLAGRKVVVQYLDPTTERWTRQARTKVRDDGTFVARWKPKRVGQFRTRALIGVSGAQAAAASPELALNVFRPAVATWYGPGFYGNQTACGIELTEETVGVAHRTLPCGTNVAIRYGATTIVVPVIDRGPFSGEAKWDLTAAAAQMLGFTATDRIGAIRLDPAAAQPASK